MDRWNTLKEYLMLHYDERKLFDIPIISVLAKMREIENDDRAERRAIFFDEPFDGEL